MEATIRTTYDLSAKEVKEAVRRYLKAEVENITVSDIKDEDISLGTDGATATHTAKKYKLR